MSDIDFDELDRAVNGALGSPSAEPEVIQPVERTRMDPTSTPTSITRETTNAPAPRRSSGRFMDIVHPSSDMRTPSSDKAPVVKPRVIEPTQPVKEVEAEEAPLWSEPLESPFLPDAKVEKRPLGGTAPAETPAPFDFQGLLDEPEEELLEAPEPQERLEATATLDPIQAEVAQTVPEKIQTTEQETVDETVASVEEAPVQLAEEPTGPTSITPQYKEQASSNQESGAIYDTESYHQPVIKPPKKKPSWLIIVWILLLVLLGAAAGWAVYAFVLPAL